MAKLTIKIASTDEGLEIEDVDLSQFTPRQLKEYYAFISYKRELALSLITICIGVSICFYFNK